MAKAEKNPGEKLVVKNRRATFDYDIDDVFEAGIVLVGSEVKSMREGRVEIVDAFASVDRGEVWLKQLHIGPFERAAAFPHDIRRARKLLLHKSEIVRIERALTREGYTLIPLRLYFKEGRVKVEVGLARGKKLHDKRDAARDREDRREMDRAMRARS